jgi:hypothetical protein
MAHSPSFSTRLSSAQHTPYTTVAHFMRQSFGQLTVPHQRQLLQGSQLHSVLHYSGTACQQQMHQYKDVTSSGKLLGAFYVAT